MRDIGHNAENIALDYLTNHNLILLRRNFYSRFGEIDLIMQDKQQQCDDIIFVEVKQRNAGIDAANESITYTKQRKLIKTAQYYLLRYGGDVNCRFDAVLIGADYSQITWLKNVIML